MTPWLHIVGIGEDGISGLTPAARAVVEAAEVIVGGDRHHTLSDKVTAERITWFSPFDAVIERLQGFRDQRVVVLATGDPLWFSVGARIGRAIPPGEITYHPQVSAFQLAAARMGWSMADLETLTVHGRPVEQMIAFIQPDQRLLILTTGAKSPAQIAEFLSGRGFGQSRTLSKRPSSPPSLLIKYLKKLPYYRRQLNYPPLYPTIFSCDSIDSRGVLCFHGVLFAPTGQGPLLPLSPPKYAQLSPSAQ